MITQFIILEACPRCQIIPYYFRSLKNRPYSYTPSVLHRKLVDNTVNLDHNLSFIILSDLRPTET